MTEQVLPAQHQRFSISKMQIVRIGWVLFGVALLLLWNWWAQEAGPDIAAPPVPIVERIGSIVADGSLFIDLLTTMWEAALGLVIGFVLGLAFAFTLLLSKRLFESVIPYVRMGFGVPKFALAPLLILWFGVGVESKVAVVALLVFFIVFEAARAGITAVDQRLVVMARVCGANDFQTMREIVLKSITPFLFASMKICLPLSVNAAVLGEFIASRHGLGSLINRARDVNDITGVFVGVVIVTVVVVALDVGLSRLRAKSLSWLVVDSRTTL